MSARDGYTLVAGASVVALIAFIVAAVLGSWIVWLAAYIFVILALIVAIVARVPSGDEPTEAERTRTEIVEPDAPPDPGPRDTG